MQHQHEPAADHADGGADRELRRDVSHRRTQRRRVGSERELESDHRENDADDIDENRFGLEDGLQVAMDANAAQERRDHAGTGHDHQRPEQNRGPPVPVHDEVCCTRRPGPRDQRADGHEALNDGGFVSQATPFEVETGFEQDDRDREADQDR